MDNYSIDVIETVLTNNIDTKYYYAGGCAGFMFDCPNCNNPPGTYGNISPCAVYHFQEETIEFIHQTFG
jgi:hypothetical protein